jgi:hypothetical protein
MPELVFSLETMVAMILSVASLAVSAGMYLQIIKNHSKRLDAIEAKGSTPTQLLEQRVSNLEHQMTTFASKLDAVSAKQGEMLAKIELLVDRSNYK